MYDFIKQLSFPAQLPVIADTVFYKKNCSYYVSREYFDSDFLRQMAIFSLSLLLSQAVLWDPDKQHPDIELLSESGGCEFSAAQKLEQ